MKPALIRRAYLESAAWLEVDCDRCELPGDLTEEEEEEVREFMRVEVVKVLRALGEAVPLSPRPLAPSGAPEGFRWRREKGRGLP